jgi:UDP-N-acetylmuramoylalanine--D-glutamate ligase
MTGAILSIDPVLMEATVSSFRGLPHRMELVREFEDRLFIDDSKATNVDAAVKAILSFSRPIVLIMGGRHKGADYKPIVEAGKGKIRCAVLVGEAKDLIAEDLEGKINYVKVKDLEHAVKVAYMISSSGDVILLSPACSSFDMFKDYKHRGEVFKKAVKALK